MSEEKKQEGRENKKTFSYYLSIAFFIVLTVSLGLFGINQFLQYRYSMVLSMEPCEICYNVNPEARACIEKPVNWTSPYDINMSKLLKEEKDIKIKPS